MGRSYSLVFVEATESAKAMIAYEKALQWRELMDLAERENTPQEDIEAMAYRIAGTTYHTLFSKQLQVLTLCV